MKHSFKPLFVALILPVAFYSCSTLKPLAPEKSDITLPPIVQPVSNIEVPVTVDLKSYFVQAENSVPNKFSGSQQNCEGLSYTYNFTRSPFAITGSNNVVNLKFTGSYGFVASYCAKCVDIFGKGPQCLHPALSAQCGMGNEPQRRMEISYKSTITVLPDFHLRSKTVLSPDPKPIDRCNVLFGNIDVTDRLIGFMKVPLNALGAQVDAKVAAFDIRPVVDQIWKNVATEYKVQDIGYVNVNPEAVRLSSFSLNGSLLNFSVGLSAKPVFTTVSNPQPVKPLPNLSSYVPATGYNVCLDLVESYDHLTAEVNKQVAGQNIKVAGNEFIVDNIKIYGIGTKIVMVINYNGTSAGTIYLVGTPVYSSTTHELSFPDLTFDLQTRAWMLKTAKWMFNGKITDVIREKATYNCGKFLADSKTTLQNQLSRDLGNNMRSVVTIHDLDIQAIYPTSDKLVIRTLSNGQVKVNVVM
jgi:hypothetical protein